MTLLPRAILFLSGLYLGIFVTLDQPALSNHNVPEQGLLVPIVKQVAELRTNLVTFRSEIRTVSTTLAKQFTASYGLVNDPWTSIGCLVLLVCLILLFLVPVLSALKIIVEYVTSETPSLIYVDSPVNRSIIELCPKLHTEKYYPTPYLLDGHLQTLATVLKSSDPHPITYYSRAFLTLSNGGVVTLDWAHSPLRGYETIVRDLPTVVILHGTTGGSQESYVRNAVLDFHNAGWQVVAFNARGCADSPLTTPQMYCGAYTQDIREVVASIRKTVKKSPLVGVGFSLGANILTKFVGEEGEECLLTSAVSVSNPYDMVQCSRSMKKFPQRYTYDRAIASNLCNYLKQVLKWGVFGPECQPEIEHALQSKSVRDFDGRITAKMFGYGTAQIYYHQASSFPYIPRIAIPMLFMTAKDDPICPEYAIPYDEILSNPNTILCTTKVGGHMMWATGILHIKSWLDPAVAEYLKAILVLHERGEIIKSQPKMATSFCIVKGKDGTDYGVMKSGNSQSSRDSLSKTSSREDLGFRSSSSRCTEDFSNSRREVLDGDDTTEGLSEKKVTSDDRVSNALPEKRGSCQLFESNELVNQLFQPLPATVVGIAAFFLAQKVMQRMGHAAKNRRT